MRYRVYFKGNTQPVEFDAYRFEVRGKRRIAAWPKNNSDKHLCSVDLYYSDDMKQIDDDHAHTVWVSAGGERGMTIDEILNAGKIKYE
jgi:hypothetical protein